MRKLLEVGAAGLAARKRTEEDLRAMQSALAQMREVIGNEELGEKADFLFHMAIATATKNPLLVSLMNNVSGMMMETMRETRRIWLFAKQTTTEQLLEDHIAIFEAIREQNIELAQERMKDHLGHVEKVLSDYISL